MFVEVEVVLGLRRGTGHSRTKNIIIKGLG